MKTLRTKSTCFLRPNSVNLERAVQVLAASRSRFHIQMIASDQIVVDINGSTNAALNQIAALQIHDFTASRRFIEQTMCAHRIAAGCERRPRQQKQTSV